MNIIETTKLEWIEENLGVGALVTFLYDNLKPYEDEPDAILAGVKRALSGAEGANGRVLLAMHEGVLQGALVLLKTGMEAYVPSHLLLFVAVRKDLRGQGIGRKLVEQAIDHAGGDLCLHVEYDNPAKRLYERIGFNSKYAEMRFSK
jgi:GNAT superfamily N-acetyltransferase